MSMEKLAHQTLLWLRAEQLKLEAMQWIDSELKSFAINDVKIERVFTDLGIVRARFTMSTNKSVALIMLNEEEWFNDDIFSIKGIFVSSKDVNKHMVELELQKAEE